jgi:hypothetical protein
VTTSLKGDICGAELKTAGYNAVLYFKSADEKTQSIAGGLEKSCQRGQGA